MSSTKENDGQSSKLSPEDRVAIVRSARSSRELGEDYEVHHSRICVIRKEADEILQQAWAGRRPGRKAKPKPNPLEAVQLNQGNLRHENESLKMRVEWLELMVKQEKNRTIEAAKAAKAAKLRKKKRSPKRNK